MSKVGEDLETVGLGEEKEEGIQLNGAGQFVRVIRNVGRVC